MPSKSKIMTVAAITESLYAKKFLTFETDPTNAGQEDDGGLSVNTSMGATHNSEAVRDFLSRVYQTTAKKEAEADEFKTKLSLKGMEMRIIDALNTNTGSVKTKSSVIDSLLEGLQKDIGDNRDLQTFMDIAISLKSDEDDDSELFKYHNGRIWWRDVKEQCNRVLNELAINLKPKKRTKEDLLLSWSHGIVDTINDGHGTFMHRTGFDLEDHLHELLKGQVRTMEYDGELFYTAQPPGTFQSDWCVNELGKPDQADTKRLAKFIDIALEKKRHDEVGMISVEEVWKAFELGETGDDELTEHPEKSPEETGDDEPTEHPKNLKSPEERRLERRELINAANAMLKEALSAKPTSPESELKPITICVATMDGADIYNGAVELRSVAALKDFIESKSDPAIPASAQTLTSKGEVFGDDQLRSLPNGSHIELLVIREKPTRTVTWGAIDKDDNGKHWDTRYVL